MQDRIGFRRAFAAMVAGLGLLVAMMVIAAFGGADTVNWNGRYLHGFAALPAGLMIVLVASLVMTGLQMIGQWVLSLASRLMREGRADA